MAEHGDGDNTNRITKSEEENSEFKVICNQLAPRLVFSSNSPRDFPNIMDMDKICRVPEDMRSVNPKAYTPQFIFIGFFHHKFQPPINIDNSNQMKHCYFQKFISVARVGVKEVIRLGIGWEERAHSCYDIGTLSFERVDCVELLILDGCFLVMHMLVSLFPEFHDQYTSSFFWRFKDVIFRDLLLFENQLPFLLLESLYNLCASSNQSSLGEFSFIQLTHQFFMAREEMSYLRKDFRVGDDILAVNHLVQFLSYMNFTHPDSSKLLYDSSSTPPVLSVWPPTATKLYDSGVSFKQMSVYSQKVFDERVGILRVPHIIINENFEIMMRNIIAYEHCSRRRRGITNFVMFMRFLLNSDIDVNLLIKEGIIQNHLETTKEVTKLFHDLCENVVIIERNLYNSECERMREYCKHRRYRWVALLKRDYFNTPWALISFIAAVVLLLLTLMQAVVAVLSMPKSK